MAKSKYSYNPPRGAEWNYGGAKWRLSRSKIEYYLNCARCFYLDNKLGWARLPGFPFKLNDAVDTLMKREADFYRRTGGYTAGGIGTLCQELNIKPAKNPNLDVWREPFEGVEYKHPGTGLLVCGGIDDLYESTDPIMEGRHYVVDYKATAPDPPLKGNRTPFLSDSYKRQIEIYQWLLRANGLSVDPTGFFFYALGDTGAAHFGNTLKFRTIAVHYIGRTAWVDKVLFQIKDILDRDFDPATLPPRGKDCALCTYRQLFKNFNKKGN